MALKAGTIYKQLIVLFSTNANKKDAVQMEAYMKDQFAFYGIKSVKRNELMKSILDKRNKPEKEDAVKLVKLLWKDPHREFQYIAMELLSWYKNEPDEKDIVFIEKLIITKFWWDTVDFIASQLVGNYFMHFPKMRNSICKKWSGSKNMWLQRSVILSQLKYKDKTDSDFLFHYCDKHKEDKEFFIRKAIGWALREYSKTNAKAVKSFVKSTNLSNLSLREASKYL